MASQADGGQIQNLSQLDEPLNPNDGLDLLCNIPPSSSIWDMPFVPLSSVANNEANDQQQDNSATALFEQPEADQLLQQQDSVLTGEELISQHAPSEQPEAGQLTHSGSNSVVRPPSPSLKNGANTDGIDHANDEAQAKKKRKTQKACDWVVATTLRGDMALYKNNNPEVPVMPKYACTNTNCRKRHKVLCAYCGKLFGLNNMPGHVKTHLAKKDNPIAVPP